MKRQQKPREIPVCPNCHGSGISPGSGFPDSGVSPDLTRCAVCGATLRWQPDKSLELHVTGVADEVASVTQRLAAELAPTAVGTESPAPSPVSPLREKSTGPDHERFGHSPSALPPSSEVSLRSWRYSFIDSAARDLRGPGFHLPSAFLRRAVPARDPDTASAPIVPMAI